MKAWMKNGKPILQENGKGMLSDECCCCDCSVIHMVLKGNSYLSAAFSDGEVFAYNNDVTYCTSNVSDEYGFYNCNQGGYGNLGQHVISAGQRWAHTTAGNDRDAGTIEVDWNNFTISATKVKIHDGLNCVRWAELSFPYPWMDIHFMHPSITDCETYFNPYAGANATVGIDCTVGEVTRATEAYDSCKWETSLTVDFSMAMKWLYDNGYCNQFTGKVWRGYNNLFIIDLCSCGGRKQVNEPTANNPVSSRQTYNNPGLPASAGLYTSMGTH